MLYKENRGIYLNVINIVIFAFFVFLYVVSDSIENASVSNSLRVLFFLCFIFFVIKWGKVKLTPPIIFGGVFILYAAFSLVWAYYRQFDSVKQIFLNYVLSTLVLQCIRKRSDLEYVIKCIAVSGIGICSLILVNINIRSLTTRISIEGFNSNVVGMLLIYSGLCCWYIFLSTKKKYWLILLCAYMILSLLSGSKKVLIMIGVSILLYMIWMNKKTLKGFLAIILLMLIIVIGIYAIFETPFLYNIIGKRTEEFFLGVIQKGQYNASDIIRENMIKRALELFLEHPFWGVGIANFERMNIYQTYSHCNYTEMLCNLGIVGFVSYYARNIYYVLMYLRMSKQKRKKEICRLAVTILILYFLLDFAMVSYYSLFHQTLLGLLYYMFFYASKEGEKEILENRYQE